MSQNLTGVNLSGPGVVCEHIALDASCYSATAIIRAIHSLAPKVTGQLRSKGADEFEVSLFPTDREAVTREQLRASFLVALGDFVLRGKLESETRQTRELIVRQAFERTNLQFPELDQAPPGLDPLNLGQPYPETGRRHD